MLAVSSLSAQTAAVTVTVADMLDLMHCQASPLPTQHRTAQSDVVRS